jgi:H+/Cl- antiporter ClcA
MFIPLFVFSVMLETLGSYTFVPPALAAAVSHSAMCQYEVV